MEIEPEKFRPQYKVYKFFGGSGGVKTRVGRVSGNNNFLGFSRWFNFCYFDTNTTFGTAVVQEVWRRFLGVYRLCRALCKRLFSYVLKRTKRTECKISTCILLFT